LYAILDGNRSHLSWNLLCALREKLRFGSLEQFQEKCVTVFRPELRKNKYLERFGDSVKR